MSSRRRFAPSYAASGTLQEELLSRSLQRTWDRVKVLGEQGNGHTGCVNALSWARGGEILLSGGDDHTVRLWRMEPSNGETDYPFVTIAQISTGHTGNIFNAHMLPGSTRIVSAAADRQIRVFDAERGVNMARSTTEMKHIHQREVLHCLRCHSDRVKRIVTEESPDVFLSVSEDGTVRQHDLRRPHNCREDGCPEPLVSVDHELSTLALSPLAPYHLVVAGDSPYGHLFDRRSIKPTSQVGDESLSQCVKRFGKKEKRSSYADHVTGARMSAKNGHEVLLSYSGDGIYLYSTNDDPETPSRTKSLVKPNSKRRKLEEGEASSSSSGSPPDLEWDANGDEHPGHKEEELEEEGEEEEDRDQNLPIVYPIRRFAGARNIDTVKDVNFLGPRDEFVASGSDDGNFFVWSKATGEVHGVYEGDSTVVNVVEGHPYLPLIAVSGIDKTVKLFSPSNGPSLFSRMDNLERIITHNARQASRFRNLRAIDLSALVGQPGTYALVGGADSVEGQIVGAAIEQCTNQ